jgi:hypothetical protein
MRRPRLAAALVALSLFVASVPAVHAAGQPVARIDAVSTGAGWVGSLLDQAFCFLGAKGYCGPAMGRAAAPLAGKLGCRIDPNGRCRDEVEAVKLGCGTDSEGRCISWTEGQDSLDLGCRMDPDGRCLP